MTELSSGTLVAGQFRLERFSSSSQQFLEAHIHHYSTGMRYRRSISSAAEEDMKSKDTKFLLLWQQRRSCQGLQSIMLQGDVCFAWLSTAPNGENCHVQCLSILEAWNYGRGSVAPSFPQHGIPGHGCISRPLPLQESVSRR